VFSRVKRAWQAATFTYDMVAGRQQARAGQVIVERTCEASAPGRSILFDRYAAETGDATRRPAVVVTHGFTHEGRRDPRLQALCRRLASAGFVVIAPEFDEMRHYRIGLGDLESLESTVAAVSEDPAVDASHIGVLAFSFGAAPTLLGLARRPLKDTVAFALIFGGYFDLKRAFKYVLTGAYEGCGFTGRVEVPQHGDDRWKFLGGNLGMIPASARTVSFADAVQQRIANPLATIDDAEWSADEHAAWALIENRDPNRFEDLYQAVGPHLHEWVARLSAVETAHGITAKLILVHSFTDQKTPFIESIAMSRGVPHAPPPMLVLLNAFAHVDLTLNWRSLRSLLRDGVPGLFGVWRIAYGVMHAARL